MLKIFMQYKEGRLIVELKGILNYFTSRKIEKYLNLVIKKHKIKYLTFNTANLIEIDKIGINSLKKSIKEVQKNSGEFNFTQNSQIKLIG